jgi:hypothetical protein
MNRATPPTNNQLNYSIGWFRLHEAALKNEHERAFLNYRLLMHSYDHKGFQYQVEGELHLLFLEYDLAVVAFQKAFLIYFYNGEYLEALQISQRIEKIQTEPFAIIEMAQLNAIILDNINRFGLFQR